MKNLCLFFVASILISLLTGTSESVPTWLQPCQLEEVGGEALCGKYEVYENRTAQSGKKIGLNVVILRALDKSPSPDPVFFLHGGPGAGATGMIPAAKGGLLEGLRKSRDLVFVDQRGTGNSNALDCNVGDDPNDLQTYYGPLFPPELIRACKDKLAVSADVRFYTTPIAIDDLDEVRAALGYKSINLVAASYGTIAAQIYMRMHPEHIRSVFLLGVATPSVKQPLLFAKGAQYALDLTFKDCEADPTCHQAFPKLREEFETLLARFDSGDQEIKIINPADNKPQTVKLTRANFTERLRLLLYTTTFARFVPLIIHHAYDNDWLPFESVTTSYNPGGMLARGQYFTVTCSEGVPFIREDDLKRESAGTFVGEERVRAHQRACELWPKGDIPQNFIGPVKSDIPVLMISGDLDASTPPWWGESALKYLPNGRQVKIRYYGHQVEDPCVWKILDQFVETGSAAKLDTSCVDNIKRPPFATKVVQSPE